MRKMSFVLALVMAPGLANAAVRTVTTVDNANTDPGQLSLKQAIEQLQDGDTIAFNIPGPGPHVIVTPEAGYALITANNVMIDGYTQPGSSPNSNEILAANNAVIQIVLDSSQGPGGSYNIGANFPTNPGFDDTESAIIAVQNGDNFKARGLSFLSRHTLATSADPNIYCFAFIDDALSPHLSGNWYGVHPDGITVSGGRASVASFNGAPNQNGTTYASGLVMGTNGDGQNDRAEFNVHVDMEIAVHLRTPNVRVSGNFVNVMPNGTDIYQIDPLVESREFVENGYGLNMIIGTDGNGVSDADERNIVGAIKYDTVVEFWRQDAQNAVFAGNWIGYAAVGSQTSTTTATLFAIRKISSLRIGTNSDGVSDDIEVNRIHGLGDARMINWHGGNADPGGLGTDAAKLVIRGNEMTNVGFRNIPAQGMPAGLSLAEYYQFALADGLNATVFAPTLVNNGTQLTGVLPTRNLAEYPHAFIDFYSVDPASYGAGRLVPGRPIATITDNGGADQDSDNHEFAVDISALGMTRHSLVIAAVTYSKDSNRTDANRSLTSLFSTAVGAGVPTVTIPNGGGAPGPYPTSTVMGANWTAAGGTTYDGTVAVNLLEQGPMAWSMTRYNRGDFAVKLSPFDPAAARSNLDIGLQDFANSDASTGPGRSWSPTTDVGILIPTVRSLGPVDHNDQQGPFFGTVSAGGFSTGNGYNMIDGTFGSGGLDVQTGKAGSASEGNFNFSTAWFPYDLGFTGGVIGYDPNSVEGAQWAGPLAHSPNLTVATIMLWNGTGGFGTLTIPGASSADGLLLATSADGASDVNIVTAAPTAGGGWLIGVREDSATDPLAFAAADQNEFAFVYIPYAAINFVGGLVDGDTGTRTAGSDNFTVSRVSTGRYEITIPGKTGATGMLALQNADTLASDPTLPDNNFLAYEYNATSGKFVVQARHTTASGTALEDTDFAFAYIDFANPVRITPAPQVDIDVSITQSAGSITLTWTGNAQRYLVEKKVSLNDATWMPVATTSANSITLPKDGAAGFFRVAAVTDPGFADVVPMTAYLNGAAERPTAVISPATGVGTVSIQGNTLHYTLSYQGFTQVPSNAHIHSSADSQAAGSVLVGISVPQNQNGMVRGTITLTDPQRDTILAGRAYFNIHTPANSGGEIRGQITRTRYTATLTGAAERPTPVDSPGTGTAHINIVGNELHYDVTWSGLTAAASAGHIHGRAGVEGFAGVLQAIPGISGASGQSTGVVTLTGAPAANTLGAIVDGQAYVNIHTGTNPSGEIRGQLTPAP